MGNLKTLPVKNEILTSLNLNEQDYDEIENEIENGVDSESLKITSFKVEQKIINITSSKSINIGGFLNGNSNIKKLQIRYLVTLFSNSYKTITTGSGSVIRKRYGYGYGVTLNVGDIDTKININYGILAASAALKKAKARYELDVYAVPSAQLADDLPDSKGDFNSKSFKELQSFFKKAKKELNDNVSGLYPIEILSYDEKSIESSDFRSIYFGALKLSQNFSLEDAIKAARRQRKYLINENIIKFMYIYFGLKDGYNKPNQDQMQKARRWITGKYNKVNIDNINDTSWIDIEPVMENNEFEIPSNSFLKKKYKPHPMPINWGSAGKLLQDYNDEVSLNFSSSIKIASLINASGSFNNLILSRTVTMSMDTSDSPYEGSEVIETRYGVGLRLKLKVSNIAIGTEISFNTIGAASELGHADVEYEISGFGISDNEFFKKLPEPINITQNNIDTITNTFDNLRDKLSTLNVDDLTPQPYRIRVNESEEVDPTIDAQAFVFSIGKVSNRTRLRDAIKEGKEFGIDENKIKKVYKEMFEITDPNTRIVNSDKREARDWLSFEED